MSISTPTAISTPSTSPTITTDALITLGNTAVLGYLPFLLAVSLFTGALTGFVSALLLRAISHVKLSH